MRLLAVFVSLGITAAAAAQQRVDLASAYELAAAADPRVAQLRLEAAQTELRLRDLELERRPAISIEGQAQYQSQIVELPLTIPGRPKPAAPKDTFDAYVRLEQPLFDATREARIGVERARLAESEARVRTAMYGLRSEVSEAFFAAMLLQEREAQIATAITDLEARLAETKIRVAERAALPGDAAAIEATLLQRRQDAAGLRASRRAALVRLAELTGRAISPDDGLVMPDLATPLVAVHDRLATLRARPEFAQLARTRERIDAQTAVIRAGERPLVSAYGRAGAGKPGFNFLDNEVNPYFVAGVRVQWRPFDWGRRDREQRIAELQQEALAADEAHLARSFERAVQNDLAAIEHLTAIRDDDDRIVALRELIESETRVRLAEQVVTAADYVDKQTDVLDARLLRAAHRVELAQAQARVLNTLGVEIQ